MKRIEVIILVLLISLEVSAQRLSADKYWVQLKDKNGSAYTINSPEEFLSPRALERRIKYNIPVTLEDLPVSEEYKNTILELGIEITGSSRWFNSLIIRCTDSLKLSELSSLSFIDTFSTGYNSFSMGGNEGIEGPFSDSKIEASTFFYGVASRQISLLGGNFLHNQGFKGNGIQIAVLDAGFYKVNEINAFNSLRKESRILAIKDFVDPASEFFTHSTHGLSVLSTMAAYIPDTFVGTAPEASYLLLRTEDEMSEFKIEEANWLMGAEFADSAGADIIATSLGYYDFPASDKMNYTLDDLTGDKALVTRAAEMAFRRGMIVVASAGNEGNNNEWIKITPPADGKNILAVGSIDTAFRVTNFSSRGNTSDGRIKPDLMAVGFRTKIINSWGDPSNGYGTSFAAPQVAGLLACLWQAVPEKSNVEIIDAVRKSSNQFNSPDSISGFGIPDFMHALWQLKNDNISPEIAEATIYPNPANGRFEIHYSNPETLVDEIDLYSSDGKLINSYQISGIPGGRVKINDLENHSPGVYYIIAKTREKEIVTKLIKQ